MYTTLEAHLDNGQISVREPKLLPAHARILVTVLQQEDAEPEAGSTRRFLELLDKTSGIIPTVDAIEWQRRIRSEWSEA